MTNPQTNLTGAGKPFLTMLEARLGEAGKGTMYLCIRDLVEHGLDLTRFAVGEVKPQRQDITQYLAAWSRHAGLSEEESRGWLIDYCTTLLKSLSKRTEAAIRHSTKGNLKYIYKSEVPFFCQCEKNPFRARCGTECPVYTEMQAGILTRAEEALHPRPYVPRPPSLIDFPLPVKKANLEQFQTAMRVAQEEVQKGTKLRLIVVLLNERGLKSRIGRKWNYATLRRELARAEGEKEGSRDRGDSSV